MLSLCLLASGDIVANCVDLFKNSTFVSLIFHSYFYVVYHIDFYFNLYSSFCLEFNLLSLLCCLKMETQIINLRLFFLFYYRCCIYMFTIVSFLHPLLKSLVWTVLFSLFIALWRELFVLSSSQHDFKKAHTTILNVRKLRHIEVILGWVLSETDSQAKDLEASDLLRGCSQ